MADNLTDTDKKIMRNDHDVLISVHTLVTDMKSDFRAYMLANNDKHEKTAVELKGLSIEQVRVMGDVKALGDDVKDVKEELKKVAASGFRLDLVIGFATILGTIIAIVLK